MMALQCATVKKTLDCTSTKDGSPYKVAAMLNTLPQGYPLPVPLDLTLPMQTAGEMLLGQKRESFYACDYGYLLGYFCTEDADCPCVASPRWKSLWINTQKLCTKQSNGRWVAKCKKYKSAQGLAATLQNRCDETHTSELCTMLM